MRNDILVPNDHSLAYRSQIAIHSTALNLAGQVREERYKGRCQIVHLTMPTIVPLLLISHSIPWSKSKKLIRNPQHRKVMAIFYLLSSEGPLRAEWHTFFTSY